MDYELEEMLIDGASPDEIGELLWTKHRKMFNGKYFYVDGRRLYPIIENKVIEGWEWD